MFECEPIMDEDVAAFLNLDRLAMKVWQSVAASDADPSRFFRIRIRIRIRIRPDR
jgi:hypothetical protein